MEIKESGIVLFTENYEVAVDYYVNKLGLNLRLKNDHLTFVDFGKSYLLIEGQGVAAENEKSKAQNPISLRIDVSDFAETVVELNERGVRVNIKKFDWGTVGVIIDPEGNRIEIKDGNF